MGSIPTATVLALTASVALLVALALSAGCHGPEEGVVYVNATDETIVVTIDDFTLTTLEAGQESVKYARRKNLLPDRMRAYSGDVLVHDQTVTWEELEANDFRYVIDGTIEPPVETSTPSSSSPTAAIP